MSYKRIVISRSARLVLIFLALILIIASTLFLYKEFKYPTVKEDKIKSYIYNSKGDIFYNVALRPNAVFESQTLEPDQIYFSSYTDSVNVSFKYDFSADKVSSISGSYEIDAVIESYLENEKDKTSLWKKRYELVKKTDFASNDKAVSISEDISLSLDGYKEFVRNITEETKVSAIHVLNVYMRVKLSAETEKGIVEEISEPTLVIPLDGNYFKITKLNTDPKPGEITEIIKVQVPPNKMKIIFLSVIAGFLALGALFIIFFTAAKPSKDEMEKKLDKIFRMHGSRLVALKSPITSSSKAISVKSVEDLVKIADEIGKPIVYQHSSNQKEVTRFYALDNNQEYYYDLLDDLDVIQKEIHGEVKVNSPDTKNLSV